MADKAIHISFVGEADSALRAIDKVQRQMEKAANDARKATAAIQRARVAEAKAAGAVRVAELKLQEVRQDSSSTLSQIARAEESLANTRRNLVTVQNTVNSATQDHANAIRRVGEEQAQLTRLTDDHNRSLRDHDAQLRRSTQSHNRFQSALRNTTTGFKRFSKSFDSDSNVLRTAVSTTVSSLTRFTLKAGAIIPAAVLLTKALFPLVGLLGLVPGAVAATAVAFGTFKVAVNGLSDAIGAGFTAALTRNKNDIKAYQEALKGLTPAARELAKAFVALQPAVRRLQTAVAERLFRGLAAQIAPLANTYLPMMQRLMVRVAGSFNRAAIAIAKFLQKPKTIEIIRKAFTDIGIAIDYIAQAIPVLLRAFLPFFSTSASFLPRIAVWIRDVAIKFANWVESAQKTGKIRDFIQNAIDALKQLWTIAKNVYEIFKLIFAAIFPGKDTLLKNIQDITTKWLAFLQSPAGQTKLKEWSDALKTFGEGLGTVAKVLMEHPDLAITLAAIATAIGLFGISSPAALIAVAAIATIVGTLTDLGGGQSKFVWLMGSIAGIVRAIGSVLVAIAKGVIQTIYNLFRDLWRILTGFEQSFFALGSNLIGSLIAGIRAQLPNLSLAWQAVRSSIPGLGLLSRAAGGFTADSTAGAGAQRTSGNSVTMNVYGTPGTDRVRLGEEVKGLLDDYFRSGGAKFGSTAVQVAP